LAVFCKTDVERASAIAAYCAIAVFCFRDRLIIA